MTFDEFDKVTEEIFKQVCHMRDSKGKEYARSEDRFANFNRLASELNLKREQVLWVYTAKHLDGIIQYVNSGRTYSTERVEGRIVDAITYLTLLAGMVRENDMQRGMNLQHSIPGVVLPTAGDLDAHMRQNPQLGDTEVLEPRCRCRTVHMPDHSTRTDKNSCPLHRES